MKGARVGLAFAAMLVAAAAGAQEESSFDATLSGFQEVPPVSTAGRGRFEATVVQQGADVRIEYELEYGGLTGPPSAAHIHFAQPGVNGAVSAFLCGGGDKPACPPEGTLSGTIDAGDVSGPEARGIGQGEIQELARAMRAGATYANVHTPQFPEGEIRGQIGENVFGQ